MIKNRKIKTEVREKKRKKRMNNNTERAQTYKHVSKIVAELAVTDVGIQGSWSKRCSAE